MLHPDRLSPLSPGRTQNNKEEDKDGRKKLAKDIHQKDRSLSATVPFDFQMLLVWLSGGVGGITNKVLG